VTSNYTSSSSTQTSNFICFRKCWKSNRTRIPTCLYETQAPFTLINVLQKTLFMGQKWREFVNISETSALLSREGWSTVWIEKIHLKQYWMNSCFSVWKAMEQMIHRWNCGMQCYNILYTPIESSFKLHPKLAITFFKAPMDSWCYKRLMLCLQWKHYKIL
jgi:hypothetical protein